MEWIRLRKPLGFTMAAAIVGTLVGVPTRQAPAQEKEPVGLSKAGFDTLHKELTSVKEPWLSLPWQLSLLEARTQAVKENKPIYMLCRSGHPLGCV